MLLGELLLSKQLITERDLDRALELQNQSGMRLGDILVAEGVLSYLPLYQAVAEHHHLPFVNLLTHLPEPGLADPKLINQLVDLRVLPIKKEAGVVTVATCDLSPEVKKFAHDHFGHELHFVITSPVDIRFSVEQLFADILSEESRSALFDLNPEQSARYTISRMQAFVFTSLIIALVVSFVVQPLSMMVWTVIVFHGLYAATMLFKWMLFTIGSRMPHLAPAILPSEKDLPVYTLMVPLYREAASLPRLFASLSALDYPKSKLDIKLVLEADDVETFEAAKALKASYAFEIIRVPPSEPRTKPKALNYALRFARGELVTIYDAEDAPEKLQLKKAVAMFKQLPPHVICLQAKLCYYNADQNWLTRAFELEYRLLFETQLPGLQQLGIPIPLGGTSNHFHLKRLRSLGEWDPYNVTEDADLGVRMALHGYGTLILHSETKEEAPAEVTAWLKQRSRWIKGYMQTWLVHMRNPFALLKTLGFSGFFGIQFFIGFACLIFLTAPIIWLLSLPAVMLVPGLSEAFPEWFGILAWINLVCFFLLQWHQALYATQVYQRKPLFYLTTLLFPFYYILHSLASYVALLELFTKPHHWRKTDHAQTRSQPQ